MSITWGDVAWEIAHAEESWQEVAKDINKKALEKFSKERYMSYFRNNPKIHHGV